MAQAPMFEKEMAELRNASITHTAFWRGLLSSTLRTARGTPGAGRCRARKWYMVFPFLGVSCILHHAPKERYGELLVTLVDAGLFDVLDDIVEDLMRLKPEDGPSATGL